MSKINLLEKTKTVNLAEVDELVSLLRGRVIVKKFEVLPSRELFSRNGGGLLVSLKQLNSNTAEIGFSRRRHEQIIRVRVRKPASLGLLCKTLRKLLQSYILSNLIKEINRATMLSGSKKIEHYDWITHHLLIAKKAGQDIENVCEHISKLYNISERDQKLIRSFWLPLHAQEAVCRDDVDWFFDTPEIREALGQLVDDSVIEEFFSQSVKINQIIALKQERVDEPEERKEETMIPDNIPETVPESVREFWPALVDEGIFHEQGVVVTSYSGFLIRKFGTKLGQAYVSRLIQRKMIRRLSEEEIVALGIEVPRGNKSVSLILKNPSGPLRRVELSSSQEPSTQESSVQEDSWKLVPQEIPIPEGLPKGLIEAYQCLYSIGVTHPDPNQREFLVLKRAPSGVLREYFKGRIEGSVQRKAGNTVSRLKEKGILVRVPEAEGKNLIELLELDASLKPDRVWLLSIKLIAVASDVASDISHEGDGEDDQQAIETKDGVTGGITAEILQILRRHDKEIVSEITKKLLGISEDLDTAMREFNAHVAVIKDRLDVVQGSETADS